MPIMTTGTPFPEALPTQAAFAARLAQVQEDGLALALVGVLRSRGSAPRARGALLALAADGRAYGTLGGGHLELQALAWAAQLLAAGGAAAAGVRRVALGPSLGQCCGGVVWLAAERLEPDCPWPRQAARALAAGQGCTLPGALWDGLRLEPEARVLALFGGGHVGRALVAMAAPLPCRLIWIDSRAAWAEQPAPFALPPQVQCEPSEPVQAAVAALPAASRVAIMSFSHAEDLEIVAACLARRRLEPRALPFVGLIGSRSKWARFRARLQARGFGDDELDQVVCPIGLPGLQGGKTPGEIALAVLAQWFADAAPAG
jgi:xanthine dehydrogenase accessory factor